MKIIITLNGAQSSYRPSLFMSKECVDQKLKYPCKCRKSIKTKLRQSTLSRFSRVKTLYRFADIFFKGLHV